MTSRSELVVPPFVASCRRRGIDVSNERIAERVRTAWANAGHTVRVWVETSVSSTHPHAVVRSDLIAGLPRDVWLARYREYLAAGGRPVKRMQECDV